MSDFWEGKRVVVTGGAGFLGTYIVEKLRAQNCSDIFVPRSRYCDLRDHNAIERLFDEAQPDLIIHLDWCKSNTSRTFFL
jgi:GDP-L-fucose synthase